VRSLRAARDMQLSTVTSSGTRGVHVRSDHVPEWAVMLGVGDLVFRHVESVDRASITPICSPVAEIATVSLTSMAAPPSPELTG
jgi:hypothetical protein